MRNLIFKRIFYCTTTILVLCFMLYFFSLCFMRNESYDKFQTFKKSKTDYDIVFLGSSHVMNAVAPMQLWNNYGITSYNLAWHGMSVIPSYWILQEAIHYHKPKIAVLDILGISNLSKISETGYFHGAFDNFPLSKTKIAAINDLFDTTNARIELLFPFYSYHNRWKESSPISHFISGLKRLSGYYTPSETKGMDLRIGVKTTENFDMFVSPYNGKESIEIEYARTFIAFCKNNDIIPVFIFIPYSAQETLYEWRDLFATILKEENVAFLDMTKGIVDFDIDQFDQNSHLNPSGARKVTNAIGNFLVQEYNLKSHKNQAEFKNWESDYNLYTEYIQKKICEQNDLKNLLMMLNNDEIYAKVEAKGNVNFTETEHKLIFENTKEIDFEQKSELETDIRITIFSKNNNFLLCQKNFQATEIEESK